MDVLKCRIPCLGVYEQGWHWLPSCGINAVTERPLPHPFPWQQKTETEIRSYRRKNYAKSAVNWRIFGGLSEKFCLGKIYGGLSETFNHFFAKLAYSRRT